MNDKRNGEVKYIWRERTGAPAVRKTRRGGTVTEELRDAVKCLKAAGEIDLPLGDAGEKFSDQIRGFLRNEGIKVESFITADNVRCVRVLTQKEWEEREFQRRLRKRERARVA